MAERGARGGAEAAPAPGRRYPAEVPTRAEVAALLAACDPQSLAGSRTGP